MSVTHAALQITDILEEIVRQLAPEMEWTDERQRWALAAMSRVSQTFHVPANRVLWARLPSFWPLLLLFPEFAKFHQNQGQRCSTERSPCVRLTSAYTRLLPILTPLCVCVKRLSEPVAPQDWAHFRTRAAIARTLLEGGPHWEEGPLDEESWSYLTRLNHGAPILPSLRVLNWCPTKTGRDLRLLASPCLRTLALHHIPPPGDQSEDGVLLAVQDMLINSPTLTEFELHNCHGDFFTRIDFAVLQQLRAVRHVNPDSTAIEVFHPEWFPEADELLVLAALPALEHLRIELCLDREPELVGFHSLKTLHIVDGGHCTLYFLENCTSPHLRELTIDLTGLSSPVYVESVMGSELPPLCTTVSQRFPQLRRLKVERESTFIADNPETFLSATRPLLTLRHLTALCLLFSEGALVLSNAIFEAFAEAWPTLTSLMICVRCLAHSAVAAAHPATVTLRALRAFSRHCPHLRQLHIPHLHVASEDCDDGDFGGSEHSPGHGLCTLAVCRAVVADDDACARALHRIFPHLNIDASRDLHSQSSHSKYGEWEQECGSTWSNILSAVEQGRRTRADQLMPP